jgi:hypothetical protein
LDVVLRLISLSDLFDVQLPGTVNTLRRCAMRFRDQLSRGARSIHAQRTTEDKSFNLKSPRALKQFQTRGDVHSCRKERIRLRGGRQDGCQMYDGPDFRFLEEAVEGAGIRDVNLKFLA